MDSDQRSHSLHEKAQSTAEQSGDERYDAEQHESRQKAEPEWGDHRDPRAPRGGLTGKPLSLPLIHRQRIEHDGR